LRFRTVTLSFLSIPKKAVTVAAHTADARDGARLLAAAYSGRACRISISIRLVIAIFFPAWDPYRRFRPCRVDVTANRSLIGGNSSPLDR